MLRPLPLGSMVKFGCEGKAGRAVGFPFCTWISNVAVSPTTMVSRSKRAVTAAANASPANAITAIATNVHVVNASLTSPVLENAIAALFALVVLPVNQSFFVGLLCIQHLLGLLGRHLRHLRGARLLFRFALLF